MTVSAATSNCSKSEKLHAKRLVVYFEDNVIYHAATQLTPRVHTNSSTLISALSSSRMKSKQSSQCRYDSGTIFGLGLLLCKVRL